MSLQVNLSLTVKSLCLACLRLYTVETFAFPVGMTYTIYLQGNIP